MPKTRLQTQSRDQEHILLLWPGVEVALPRDPLSCNLAAVSRRFLAACMPVPAGAACLKHTVRETA